MTPDSLQISVVLCTYNRAERIERVVHRVLDQRGCNFELVVVDDGSTDATPEVLASIENDRLRVVRRPNGGLGAARNTGLQHARGHWTVFLDDDDLPEEGWLATLARPMTNPEVGITCCGVTGVNPDGVEIRRRDPTPLGELFDDAPGLFLAGAFAARTDLLRRTGGYLEGLGVSHQLELFIRLLSIARNEGLTMVAEDARVLRIEWRQTTARPLRNPRRMYDGTRWILARHPEAFARTRTNSALFEGIAGVNGARIGEWNGARRHLLRAARAKPTSATQWGRLMLAVIPPIGRRVWGRHGSFASHDASEIGVPRQRLDDDIHGNPELFLAWRYQENTPGGGDRGQSTTAIRWLSRRLARRHRWEPVIDVARINGDLNDQATWDGLMKECPGLTMCANVIERIDHPIDLLHRLARVSAGGPVLLSTPDRAVVDPHRPIGPPSNPRHRREWTRDQFELLLLSTGFSIEQSWFLPRRWEWLTRPLQRLVRRPDFPRHGAAMVFLVQARLP